MFSLAKQWVWDFWFAEDGSEHHLFYLQAPRSLGDPELRHHHATIGHAVSGDFRTWTVLPDALGPGAPGAWDDLAVWTGSVLWHDGRWNLLYTGVSRAEFGLVQRIGLATSTDLVTWERHGKNPVLEATGRWYAKPGDARWTDCAWRDPFLFRQEGDSAVQVLITARAIDAAPDGAGVIARARSEDLVEWEVREPLTSPGEFAQVEVAQLVPVNEASVVLFSCLAADHSARRLERLGGAAGTSGTFAFIAKGPGAPFRPTDSPVASAPGEVLYAGKLVPLEGGGFGFMAFRGDGDDGFVGELTDLLPAHLPIDGNVVIPKP